MIGEHFCSSTPPPLAPSLFDRNLEIVEITTSNFLYQNLFCPRIFLNDLLSLAVIDRQLHNPEGDDRRQTVESITSWVNRL